MTILQGDIQLRASQVMLDVANGGGAPTSTQIVDGQSNGIFPDVSEVDRAGGNLSARKVFVKVLTNNTDSYLGSNVIVEEPPSDPRVSVTLFSTESTFDEREDARKRIESYLTVGPQLSGYLFGDHIVGQRTITLLSRTTDPLPTVGQTFVVGKANVIRDPSTGEVLDESVSEVARLQVTTVREKLSICEVISGDAGAVAQGMMIQRP